MSLVIANVRLIDPLSHTDRVVDLRVAEGRVAEIAAPQALAMGSGATQRLDGTGLWVLPGLIDLHVHLREPGEEYKEDIASGSRAAVAGGFTTIVAMPNTKPVIDSAELVQYVRERGRAVGLLRVLPTGSITAGQAGERLAPIGELCRAGAVAVTDDGRYVSNARLMRSALEYARDFAMPVMTHAEEMSLSKDGHMHEGAVATRLGIAAVPRLAEDVAVARDLLLAQYTGAHLHVCHVSSAAAVELIRVAKSRGVRVTAEATPHHFTLTDVAVEGYATHAKMNPPLREETDRLAVIAGLKDGTLDAVATDHAPHSSMEKDVPFVDAAHGVIGLQTALPLTLDLWRQGHLSVMDAVRCMTSGPAQVLGLAQGRVAVGAEADLALINPEAEWQFGPDVVLSKSCNSPFLGRTLKGRVEMTLVAGKVVYQRSANLIGT